MAYNQVNPDVEQGGQTEGPLTICQRGEKPETRCLLGEVDTVFYKFYVDKLKADIESAQSGYKTAWTDLRSVKNARHSKFCLLDKADDTYQEYKSLDQCLSARFDQSSDEIVARIKLLEQRDQESVAAFNATHTAVKELKKKVGELKDVACKLRYGLSDPCNSEQMQALSGQIIATVDAEGNPDQQAFADIAQYLINRAEDACVKVNTTFEISVKLAGIHAYLNVASLKPLADAFAKSVDAFKADVDANLKSSGDEWKKLYEEYVKIMRGINTGELAVRSGKWKQYSLCTTKYYACDADDQCRQTKGELSPEEKIKRICDQVEECFQDDCPSPKGDDGVRIKPKPGGTKAPGGKSYDL